MGQYHKAAFVGFRGNVMCMRAMLGWTCFERATETFGEISEGDSIAMGDAAQVGTPVAVAGSRADRRWGHAANDGGRADDFRRIRGGVGHPTGLARQQPVRPRARTATASLSSIVTNADSGPPGPRERYIHASW